MLNGNEPIFEKHTVLRAQALNDGILGTRKMLELVYTKYSNGIISGFDIRSQGEELEIGRGLVLYQGRMYYMEQDLLLSLSGIDSSLHYVKIVFFEERIEDGERKRSTDIVINKDNTIRDNEMELCRFRYQNGASLRSSYRDLEDYSTDYNTINIVHAPYAAVNEETINPIITTAFGEGMLKRMLTDSYDTAFALECIRGEQVSRKSLILYINHKLNTGQKNMTNEQIHKYLCEILNSSNEDSRRMLNRERRMIIT